MSLIRPLAACPALLQVLGVNSTMFAFGLGDHIHAPNERLLEDMYHTGRLAWVDMLAVLGEQLAGKLPADAPLYSRAGAAAAAAGTEAGKIEL